MLILGLDGGGRSLVELVNFLQPCRGHACFGCFWLVRLPRGPLNPLESAAFYGAHP